MESGDGSGEKQGPNEQGGFPSSSSSSSSWFGSTVTGLLGMPQESEHAEKEDEEAKAEEADDSLTSSVTQWLGLGGQGEIDETTLGHEKEDKERTEMGEAGGAFTSTVNSWLGYGNGKTEDAEKSVKVEIVEEEEKKERFRSRKLALDLESHQLQEEELAIPGTFDWLGDTLSSKIGFGLTHQDSGLKKTTNKEKVENTNKEVKSSPSHSWYDIGIGDVLGFGNDAGKFDSKQQQQQQQQQHNEKEIITDNKVETKTEMLSAGVNSEEYSVSSVSSTSDFPLEQSQEESKIETELRDTVPLDGDSDIDDVLDSRGMLIADNESEVANLDEDNTLQSELEKNHPTVLPSDRFLSMLDNVLSLDEDVDDNDEGGETKPADEKDSVQTKHGNYPDLSQYSLRSENNEGSIEAGLDGNAAKHEEGNTKTGMLNPGVAQTNTVEEEIFASTQFHDTMQQSQGDNRYEGDSKETAQATDDGLNNPVEAEELISSHREALSDSVARKLKETEMNEIMTHVNKVELKTDAALDQPRSNEADVSQHMLRYSEDNKSSFPTPDILTFGIVDRYTNMDTIDQSSSPPPMSGSAERGDNDTDSLNLDISNTGAETDDEHPITEDQTAEVTAVFEKETFHESGEPSVSLFEIAKSPKSTTGENTIGDTVFGTEHSPFSNMANLKEETQVETQRKDEVKEEQQVEKETKIGVNLQIGNDKEEENIDEGEDKESLDGNPAMENHSSVIRDNSKVPATEGMNLDQITLDERQREGESNDFMVSVKATDAGAAWAGAEEAISIESESSYNSGHISEHIKRRSKSELDSDDNVSGLFVSQTGIVKQEEVNVDKTSPGRLFNDKVINPKEIYDQKNSDSLDTPGEKSSFNNVVLGPTKEFQPEDNYKLYSGVANFPEPLTGEMTKSDQQSDNTDQGATIGKEEENKNSENDDISITEQSDSMVTNSDDVKNSASHNGAVFSEHAVFIDSMAPTPTVENKDIVQSESGGGAFGMFKNAFSYFSPTPSAERQDFKPNLDSSGTEKTSQPGGSLSSEVKHVVDDTTPAKGVVPDAPTSFHTLQLQHQETSIPMPSAQYQSQSNFDSCSQHPTPEVPNKAGTVTFPKKHKALHAHFSVEETALLTELFGQHKLQWLDFILSNPESMDNDPSILLDMENLLLYHVDKLAQRQNTAKTRGLTSLKKLKILLSRVKDILNTGKSDIEGIHTYIALKYFPVSLGLNILTAPLLVLFHIVYGFPLVQMASAHPVSLDTKIN